MKNYAIQSEEEYQLVMEKIETYLQKATQQGEKKPLTAREKKELRHLSVVAEAWEDSIPMMPIPEPQSIPELIQLKMYEMKIKQKEMAALLQITPSKLSQILNGKAKANLKVVKNMFLKLDIEAEFLLGLV